MILTEVRTIEEQREFLELPLIIYKNDPNYIRPLDSDILQVFDEEKNKYFQPGSCIRWILKTHQGTAIGRIAAFVNHQIAYTFDQPTGGIGFFECIESKEAAFLLFDAAKEWLLGKGIQAMDGPVNLGDRDRWWGLLAEGFYQPCYCSNYNPPYYQKLFEEYGFELYFKQYTYQREVNKPLKPVHYAIAERLKRSGDYSFMHIKRNNLDKFIEDFRHVYNKAWLKHDGVGEMSFEQAQQVVKPLKPVIDERIIWFAYYKEEAIGFFISIPELNQLFVKYLDGVLDTFGKLRLLYNKWTGGAKTMFGLVFGIVPEHQKKGVEIALIVEAHNNFKEKVPYNDIQMNWIGDFNPRMMAVAEQIGAKIYKAHHTYRYLFDRNKKFERHPEI